MAAGRGVSTVFASRVLICSRSGHRCMKQFARLCHIPVQESAPSLVSPQGACSPSAQLTSRLPKTLRKNLLSNTVRPTFADGLQTAYRTYSVLPQRAIYTTPVWLHENGDADSRKCWNCSRPTDPVEELFFCECGVVQTPAHKMTYFKLFNIDQSFQIDPKKLSMMYKELQKRLHPDMFSNKSETEQELAEQQSSLLNKAYFTLLKPLSRALYLLELHGYEIEEGTTDINPEFLMEILDLNERIGESNTEDIEEIEKEIANKIEENTERLSAAFAADDLEKAQEIAVRLKYYVNVESKVKAFYRDRM